MTAVSGQRHDGFATVLLRCSEADSATTKAVYQQYQPQLVRLARNLGADDPEGSADLAFFDGLRAIENLHTRSELSFRSYLYTATRNRVVSERRRGVVETTPLDWKHERDAEAGVENEVVDSLFLRSALRELTSDQRDVIVHRFFGGYSSEETARRLGKTSSAVRRLQHTGLKNLRNACVAAGLIALVVVVALIWRGQAAQQRIDIGPVVELPEPTPGRLEPAPLVTTTAGLERESTRSPATQLSSGSRSQRSAPIGDQPSPLPSSASTAGQPPLPQSSIPVADQPSSSLPSSTTVPATTRPPRPSSTTVPSTAGPPPPSSPSTTPTTAPSTTPTLDDDDDDDDDVDDDD